MIITCIHVTNGTKVHIKDIAYIFQPSKNLLTKSLQILITCLINWTSDKEEVDILLLQECKSFIYFKIMTRDTRDRILAR